MGIQYPLWLGKAPYVVSNKCETSSELERMTVMMLMISYDNMIHLMNCNGVWWYTMIRDDVWWYMIDIWLIYDWYMIDIWWIGGCRRTMISAKFNRTNIYRSTTQRNCRNSMSGFRLDCWVSRIERDLWERTSEDTSPITEKSRMFPPDPPRWLNCKVVLFGACHPSPKQWVTH